MSVFVCASVFVCVCFCVCVCVGVRAKVSGYSTHHWDDNTKEESKNIDDAQNLLNKSTNYGYFETSD